MVHDSFFLKLRKSFSFFGLSFFCILLTLFFLPLVYLPIFRSSYDLPKEVILYTAVSIIFIATLFEIIKNKTIFYKRTILDKPFLFLFGAGVISTLLSKNSSLSFWGKSDNFVFHFFALLLFLVWSWQLIQKIKTERLLQTASFVFLLSGTLASLFFLVSEFSWFVGIFPLSQFNLVANLNSTLGIYAVIVLVLSLGILFSKKEKIVPLDVMSFFAAICSFLLIVRLDFYMLWALVCLGMGLLFLIGMAFWGGIRKSVVGATFAIFVFSLLHLLLPNFLHFGRALPTEVNLNPSISKTIVEGVLTSHTKNFLFGSGPGTFIYDFSLFRPQSLNENSYFWSVRFHTPWSSIFSFVSEFGFIGSLSFILIVLLIFGSVLSAVLHIRSTVWKKAQFFVQKISVGDFHFEYFVFMIAWILLTVGLCVSVYNFTLWFLWWTLLSFVVLGLAYIQPSLVHEHEKRFDINPQYIFVFSFFFLLMSSFTLIGGVIWGKTLQAEYFIFQAEKNPSQSEMFLNSALRIQPNASGTVIRLSRYFLQESQKYSESNPEQAARLLSQAIDTARVAKDLDPDNIEVYEILSFAYIQSIPFTSELSVQQSLVWATDALNHALTLEPTNPVFHSEMGVLQEFSGQLDAAKKSYEASIQLKSDYAEGYFSLGRLYEKQNNIDGAIRLYEQYIEKDSKNADILYELGKLYYNRKQGEDDKKAEKIWISSLQFAPNSSNTLYSLGLLYERRGENALAKKYFEQVKTLNPGNKDIEKKLQSL